MHTRSMSCFSYSKMLGQGKTDDRPSCTGLHLPYELCLLQILQIGDWIYNIDFQQEGLVRGREKWTIIRKDELIVLCLILEGIDRLFRVRNKKFSRSNFAQFA